MKKKKNPGMKITKDMVRRMASEIYNTYYTESGAEEYGRCMFCGKILKSGSNDEPHCNGCIVPLAIDLISVDRLKF